MAGAYPFLGRRYGTRRGPVTAGGGGATDPNYANVISLLHFDGANGSTTFTDQKGIVYTPTGGAKLSTANAKFGTAAADFTTTGSYLMSASDAGFGVGTIDFTAEAFILLPATGSLQSILDTVSRSTTTGWVFYVSSSGVLTYTGGATIAGGTIAAGAYTHVAVARQSGTVRIFAGGVLAGTVADAANFPTTALQLGNAAGNTATLAGYMDEFRFTRGVARYTANFTPPTAAFPNS